ncbi:MAG TPA: D-alanine--D-alanine ligase family protein [Actinopolymorphaceae bacterium]|jgi:D-alanine-D-alanine ligase
MSSDPAPTPDLPAAAPSVPSELSAVSPRVRVALIFGGRSSEHAVSCSTAASVLQAIDRDRYDVVPIGITTGGAWVLEADDPGRLALTPTATPQVDRDARPVVLRTDPARGELIELDPVDGASSLAGIDVVFPLLHGPFGEDGTLQGLLEMAGMRYVGGGVLSSAVAMDKAFAKVVLAGAGLPVTPYTVFRITRWRADPAPIAEAVAGLGYPVFVKPARGGSSLGIKKVRRPEDLGDAIEFAATYDPKVLVEAAVENAREIECGVLERLDGHGADTSPVAEIVVGEQVEFYDFAAKYLSTEEQVALKVPATLPDGVAEKVQKLAADAFAAIDGEGLARVDFFLTAGGELLLNEVNTLPGFTPLSMFPRMWAHTGLGYADLVDRLIRLALARPSGLR